MRTPLDRLRHALLFEIVALMIVIPVGAMLFGIGLKDMGVIGVGSATLATLWNYVYNYGFDRAMTHWRGTTLKTTPIRVAHALLFEAGLLTVLLPFIAWWLGISLWQAFVMDIGIAAFYVVYAFLFNLAYDRIFPLAEWGEGAKTAHQEV